MTVTPLRISSLDQFGAIEKAGQRILGVERAKVPAVSYEANFNLWFGSYCYFQAILLAVQDLRRPVFAGEYSEHQHDATGGPGNQRYQVLRL